MINNYCVNSNYTIEKTIKKISDSGQKCVIVVQKDKLIGTISDGDIRKVIIKKINIKSKI